MRRGGRAGSGNARAAAALTRMARVADRVFQPRRLQGRSRGVVVTQTRTLTVTTPRTTSTTARGTSRTTATGRVPITRRPPRRAVQAQANDAVTTRSTSAETRPRKVTATARVAGDDKETTHRAAVARGQGQGQGQDPTRLQTRRIPIRVLVLVVGVVDAKILTAAGNMGGVLVVPTHRAHGHDHGRGRCLRTAGQVL